MHSDTIEVIETDQWTSTGDVTEHHWSALKARGVDAITGGDSAAAKAIFGGRLWFRDVRVNAQPSIGHVWFIQDPETQKPLLWKCHYDSSG